MSTKLAQFVEILEGCDVLLLDKEGKYLKGKAQKCNVDGKWAVINRENDKTWSITHESSRIIVDYQNWLLNEISRSRFKNLPIFLPADVFKSIVERKIAEEWEEELVVQFSS